MAINLTTLLSGLSVGALVSPTYTLTEDRGPNNWTRQSIVTAVGGTMPGVRTHSMSDPFTLAVSRQAQPAAAPRVGTSGIVGKLGRNTVKAKIRKGTIPLVGQAAQISDIDIAINVVSGAETADLNNVTALIDATIAWLHRERANFVLAAQTGNV